MRNSMSHLPVLFYCGRRKQGEHERWICDCTLHGNPPRNLVPLPPSLDDIALIITIKSNHGGKVYTSYTANNFKLSPPHSMACQLVNLRRIISCRDLGDSSVMLLSRSLTCIATLTQRIVMQSHPREFACMIKGGRPGKSSFSGSPLWACSAGQDAL